MGIASKHSSITRMHRRITRMHSGAARRRRRRIVDPIHAASEKGLSDNDIGYVMDSPFGATSVPTLPDVLFSISALQLDVSKELERKC